METLLKNKKGLRRWVSYNRKYIQITRDNGATHYYKYNARRLYLLLEIKTSYEVQTAIIK